MPDGGWLTKSEVNSLYYNAVAGDLVFATEAQYGFHPGAVAKLISGHAASLGKRSIRVLEIGASTCIFAHAVISDLRRLSRDGASELERVDYLAVEFARASLEAAADLWEHNGLLVRRGPPAHPSAEPPLRPALVAFLSGDEPIAVNLAAVHAEANQFAQATTDQFDFVILNELLDDMPYRAFYADADGGTLEVIPHARYEDGRWRLRVAPQPVDGDTEVALEPGTITGSSEESVVLVSRVAELLAPGGMLLLHDYGFAETAVDLDLYAAPQPSVPELVAHEFPPGEERFPRSFFRVFANEPWGVVQVTNDVNFAELAAALEERGPVTILAHGSTIPNRGREFDKDDGVFLSAFSLLQPGDDLPAVLADLHGRQAELRRRYFDEYMDGRANAFLDLVFVKDTEPRGT